MKKLEDKIQELDKSSKRNILTINMLEEEIKEKNESISSIESKLSDTLLWQEKAVLAIIETMDSFDDILNFASNSQNHALLTNVNIVKNNLKSRMSFLNIVEIKTVGEIFNPKYHECIDTVNLEEKKRNEIVDVLKKGYLFNKKVIRVAKVIAAK